MAGAKGERGEFAERGPEVIWAQGARQPATKLTAGLYNPQLSEKWI